MTINMPGVFKNFKIEFLESESSSPQIHYLVGNNGSGKTLVLNAIFNIRARKRVKNSQEIEFILSNGIVDSISYNNAGLNDRWPQNREQIPNMVFLNSEIFSKPANIKSVTGSEPDQESDIDESTRLNQVIPQLLIDIEAQDNRISHEFLSKNKGMMVLIPEKMDHRLQRFTDTFDKFFVDSW